MNSNLCGARLCAVLSFAVARRFLNPVAGAAALLPLMALVPAGAATLIPTSMEVGNAGATRQVRVVESEIPWAVVENAPWLTASITEGFGTRYLEIAVAPNATGLTRTGTVTIAGTDFTVKQRGSGPGPGELWVTGSNWWGQLGYNQAVPQPIDLPGSGSATFVAAGSGHALFILNDGSLWGMGWNGHGELGGAASNYYEPKRVASGATFAAAGSEHTVFIKSDKTLWGLGANGDGQLGLAASNWTVAVPTQIASQVRSVAAGGAHTVFLKEDGTLWGMGYNYDGGLGLGEGAATQVYSPTFIAADVRSVWAGGAHTLFLKEDGTLWAMGKNDSGQLGDGSWMNRRTPVQVAAGVAMAAAGPGHSVLVKTDGTVWGTGANNSGQLGDGTYATRPSFTLIPGVTNVASVWAAFYHTLFTKTDGTLWTTSGGGDGTTWSRAQPIQVARNVLIGAAGNAATLFVDSAGKLWGYGYNGYGVLAWATVRRTKPVLVDTEVVAVAANTLASFWVKSDRTLWAAGQQWTGHGFGNDGSSKPGQIATDVVSVSTGSHLLFLKSDGTLWTQVSAGAPPGFAPIATDVIATAGGYNHSLFLKRDGSVWAMGQNSHGELGDGTRTARTQPVRVLIDEPVVAIGAGYEFSTFVTQTNRLWATGGFWGNLIHDFYQDRPREIASGVGGVWSGKGWYPLYLTLNGTLMEWSGAFGPLGENVSVHNPAPREIESDVAFAVDGVYHRLIAKNDGSLWADGYNGSGQLGNGTIDSSGNSPRMALGHGPKFQLAAGGAVAAAAAQEHTLFVLGDARLGEPVVSGAAVSGTYGQNFRYFISATNNPTTFDALNLPAALSINHATGEIAGILQQVGAFTIDLAATNAAGTGLGTLMLEIRKAVSQISIDQQTQLFDGLPKQVSVTTTPAGLTTQVTYDGSPTPPANVGRYQVLVTVTDPHYEGIAHGTLDIRAPAPIPVDVTSQVRIDRGGFRLNRTTRLYVQEITITNTSTQVLAGPVSLLFDQLSPNATLRGVAAFTAAITPLGTPYLQLNLGADAVLAPGETVSINAEFTNSNNQSITYTSRVLAGPGTR